MLISKYVPSKLFPKQIAVSMLPHMEALYGGQAGGGKSELLLALALQYVHIPGYSAIVFRRTLTDLKQPGALLDRAHSWLRGAPGCRFAGDEHTYYFETHWPNGVSGHPAKLAFGYIGEANIQTRYQSAEYQTILWDELTQHEEANYLYLFSRLRKKVCPVHKTTHDGKPNYKSDCMYCQVYSSLPLRVRGATNPGGIGHQWVRDRFQIEPAENIPIYEIREDDTNINWIGKHPDRPFIQASYRDNPHIDQEGYAKALDELPPIEKARLKYGNWAVNVDARFKRRWVKHYSTRGDRYFSLGRDGVGRVVDFKNDIQRTFVTVDPAASKREGMTEMVVNKGKDASWTVIAVWALTNDYHLLLLDVIRFQDEIPAVVQALVEVNKRWHPAYFRIEGNGLGKGVVQYSQIYGLTVKEGKRYTDKVVNSTAAQLRMEQGRIWFPQWAPWLKDWEDEIFNWTGDDTQADDQVDVLADAAQDVVWEAGDDRDNKEEYTGTTMDYPGWFGYDSLPTYGI
jgi:predicted phage terminase large subunit-like protein